jgi:hypothetical protein
MESTSVSSRFACYRARADIRFREVPEMEFCFVYVPARAELYRLNPAAWFVFRMCEGASDAAIAAAYHAALQPDVTRSQSVEEVRRAIASLLDMGIIEQVPHPPQSSSHTKRRVRHGQEK